MAFPTVTLFDSFKRAEEDPLSNGGKWVFFVTPDFLSERGPKVREERLESPFTYGSGPTGAYWTPKEYADIGVAVMLDGEYNEEGKSAYYLFARLGVSEEKWQGYFIRLESTGTAGKYNLTIRKWKNTGTNKSEALATVNNVAIAKGDRLGLACIGTTISAWTKAGAGAWTEVTSVVDATFSKGWIGVALRDAGPQPTFLNFEAGEPGAGHEHTLSVSQPQSPTKAVALARTLTVAQPQSPSHSEVFGPKHAHTLTIAQTQVVVRLLKQEQQRFKLTQSQTVTMGRALARTLSVAQPQSPVLTKVDLHVATGLLPMVI